MDIEGSSELEYHVYEKPNVLGALSFFKWRDPTPPKQGTLRLKGNILDYSAKDSSDSWSMNIRDIKHVLMYSGYMRLQVLGIDKNFWFFNYQEWQTSMWVSSRPLAIGLPSNRYKDTQAFSLMSAANAELKKWEDAFQSSGVKLIRPRMRWYVWVLLAIIALVILFFWILAKNPY